MKRLIFSAIGFGIVAIASQFPVVLAAPLAESLEGSVLIQRGRSRFVPVPQETGIGNRDIIYVGDESRLVILCDPDTLSGRRSLVGPVRSGIRAVCDESRSLNRNFCTSASEFIEGRDPEIPYVISPRNGTILNSEILFSWNPVAQTDSYHVRLEALSEPLKPEVIWTTTTSETQLVYPNETALALGTPYTLTVETDSGISSIENNNLGPLSRSFTLAEDTREVEALLASISDQNLSEEEALLARVAVYTCRDRPLVANAINDLEEAVSNGASSPALFRTLGDLYYGSGLALLSEQRYLQVIRLADLTVDLEDWIAAQEGIARVYSRTGQSDLAVYHLQQAELGAYYTCDRNKLEGIAEFLTALAQGSLDEGDGEEAIAVEPLSCQLPTADAPPSTNP